MGGLDPSVMVREWENARVMTSQHLTFEFKIHGALMHQLCEAIIGTIIAVSSGRLETNDKFPPARRGQDLRESWGNLARKKVRSVISRSQVCEHETLSRKIHQINHLPFLR